MLEKAVLDGKALQLWELPVRLHDNEKMLREFFVRHFDRTPAARVKTVAFINVGSGETNRDSRSVGGDVMVEFFDVGAVELVLSRIIQHELLERDELNHMELRRGYIYLGHDRLLVEGVVHLPKAPPEIATGTETEIGSKAHQYMLPDTHGNNAVATRCGSADDVKVQKDAVQIGVWDARKEKKHDDDDDPGRRFMVNGGTSLQATQIANGTGTVVLCMTFVCTFDCNHRSSAALKDGEREYGVTPHVIFQLLRGTCFVRKAVMFRRELENKSGSNRRMVRALVEVGGNEEANSVVKAFHATTLELAAGEPGSEVVEYRCRVYARFNNEEHTNRELNVPVNTDTALSVTPQNLSLMGPMFRRDRHDREVHPGDRDDNAAGENPERNRNRSRGRCERSSRERHRRYSRRHSSRRRSSEKYRQRSREHHNRHGHHHSRHHRHRSESDERIHEEYQYQRHRKHEVTSTLEGTIGVSDYQGHHYPLYPEQQQLPLCGGSIAVSGHADGRQSLPPGWRAVFSDEYQRVYYVYRNPTTGVEVSSWEVRPLQ